ncbi:hypothetical protein SAMN02910456_01414 [Ruminococcaceae bacterium YRB3002]|nr:hypothetical protein SAMN02910456_01414 [Ruminococcaceae bacterium YRB3002]
MNSKKCLITTGIIASISSLIMTAIPFGTGILEIINAVIFAAGIAAILFSGLVRKNDRLVMISSIIYAVLLSTVTLIIEAKLTGFTLVAVGFVPGAIMSVTALIRTAKGCKSKASYIVNGIALFLALAGLAMAVLKGGFVMQ